MRALAPVSLALAAMVACAANAPSGSANPRPEPPVTDSGRAVSVLPVAPLSPSAVSGLDASPPVVPLADVAKALDEDASAGAVDAASLSTSLCNEQAPQDFLVRGQFLKAGAEGNQRAIQYRTDHYGYFKGYGHPAPGAQPPSAFVVPTTFMGISVEMHRKVVPALACVEREIAESCADHPYTPHALAGIRYRNTYRGGEVTNHAYGIAIDIDPTINTCCGCVPPWNDAPACHKHAKSEYDRMAMPECWVHAFERYGFYWLGHDTLRDTMHFEFLGDPDRILKK
jgi:hypothetical protein